MGIHSFYSYLKRNFPKCINRNIFKPDNLYLDLNAIFHPCAQAVFNPKRLLDDENNSVKKVENVYIEACKEIDRIVRLIMPTRRLVLCIDGTAPLGKQQQQRCRRYLSANSRSPDTPLVFDTCSISPGTEFMTGMRKIITRFIKLKKKGDVLYKQLDITFLPDTIPGEGEHKALSIIRNSVGNTETHVVYSPDADLVMISLGTLKKKIYIARELDGMNKCPLYYVDVDMFKDMFISTYSSPGTNNDNLILDFILLFFMVGNDFLPNIPTLSIIENGMERVFDTYKFLFSCTGKHLTTMTATEVSINVEPFKMLLSELGNHEKEMVVRKLNSRYSYFEDKVLENNRISTAQGYDVDFDGYKKDYYKKISNESVGTVCTDYLNGMNWVINYYVYGVRDWRWRYPYNYAPFLGDLANSVGTMTFRRIEKNEPISELLQLMFILPPSSFNLLPSPLDQVCNDPDLSSFYPSKVEVDLSGKRYAYEGVVIVPLVDIEKVTGVYNRLLPLVGKRKSLRI